MSEFNETPLQDMALQLVMLSALALIIIVTLLWAFFSAGGTIEW